MMRDVLSRVEEVVVCAGSLVAVGTAKESKGEFLGRVTFRREPSRVPQGI
jgi:hypothetical protein